MSQDVTKLIYGILEDEKSLNESTGGRYKIVKPTVGGHFAVSTGTNKYQAYEITSMTDNKIFAKEVL